MSHSLNTCTVRLSRGEDHPRGVPIPILGVPAGTATESTTRTVGHSAIRPAATRAQRATQSSIGWGSVPRSSCVPASGCRPSGRSRCKRTVSSPITSSSHGGLT